MPARLPVDALRSAMERAADHAVAISDRGTHIRLSVPVPEDRERFRALLDVLLTADHWGSSDGTGELRMWGAVQKGLEP
ncbi:hypothetical protein SAMN05216532_4030 [Streptomyces sp. 2231.1]|uniref:hypothetical protein n=1 Tax=Streptomyces sp. 2231.1 TaxID=1855347 RepID=UPI000896D758|nr:hypothetical protein [Streptomyces sp. 2231.1]SED27462.1 hypothetical protein SAMN05216532_4030 [Streptomyces sp. 2231.1]